MPPSTFFGDARIFAHIRNVVEYLQEEGGGVCSEEVLRALAELDDV